MISLRSNPFLTNVPILYPLKTPENLFSSFLMFSGGIKMRVLTRKGLRIQGKSGWFSARSMKANVIFIVFRLVGLFQCVKPKIKNLQFYFRFFVCFCRCYFFTENMFELSLQRSQPESKSPNEGDISFMFLIRLQCHIVWLYF